MALQSCIESDIQIIDDDTCTTLERYVSHENRVERLMSGTSSAMKQSISASENAVTKQVEDVSNVESLDRYMAAITCPTLLAEAKLGMKR